MKGIQINNACKLFSSCYLKVNRVTHEDVQIRSPQKELPIANELLRIYVFNFSYLNFVTSKNSYS